MPLKMFWVVWIHCTAVCKFLVLLSIFWFDIRKGSPFDGDFLTVSTCLFFDIGDERTLETFQIRRQGWRSPRPNRLMIAVSDICLKRHVSVHSLLISDTLSEAKAVNFLFNCNLSDFVEFSFGTDLVLPQFGWFVCSWKTVKNRGPEPGPLLKSQIITKSQSKIKSHHWEGMTFGFQVRDKKGYFEMIEKRRGEVSSALICKGIWNKSCGKNRGLHCGFWVVFKKVETLKWITQLFVLGYIWFF